MEQRPGPDHPGGTPADDARRELRRRLAAGWSTALLLRAVVVIFVAAHLVNGVVMLANPSWRTHVAFGTERTDVEVVAVEQNAVSCGRYVSGDRLVVRWTDDDGEQEGTLECVGSPAVGDHLTAYPVAGERGYDWPAWEFWLFTAIASVLGGAVVAALRAVLRGFGDSAPA